MLFNKNFAAYIIRDLSQPIIWFVFTVFAIRSSNPLNYVIFRPPAPPFRHHCIVSKKDTLKTLFIEFQRARENI